MKIQWISLIVLLTLVLGSCGTFTVPERSPDLHPSEPPAIPSEESPGNQLQLTPTLEPSEMPPSPPVEKFVSLAKKDLAIRLQIDVSTISLVKSEGMIWLNIALGCPRPGKFYPQGKVPGYRIWLNAEGKEYLYHTDYNGQLILCPELNPDLPGSTTTPTQQIGVPID